ncbi:MAG: SEC-C metal-binding domain-containing protein [Bryobacteraceae bacterium]
MNSPHTLTAQQHQVLTLIAAGSTVTAAATAAGVHRNTVGNWLRLSAFRQALDDAHAAQALHWREQAELLAADALQALKSLLQNPATRDSVRLKAALAILDRVSAPLPAPPENLHIDAQFEPDSPSFPKTGRNDLCPCGSGIKYKKCCLGKPHAIPPGFSSPDRGSDPAVYRGADLSQSPVHNAA